MNVHTLPSSYFVGRKARDQGKPKIVPAELNGPDRYWWFCGWNESDQENNQCRHQLTRTDLAS